MTLDDVLGVPLEGAGSRCSPHRKAGGGRWVCDTLGDACPGLRRTQVAETPTPRSHAAPAPTEERRCTRHPYWRMRWYHGSGWRCLDCQAERVRARRMAAIADGIVRSALRVA